MIGVVATFWALFPSIHLICGLAMLINPDLFETGEEISFRWIGLLFTSVSLIFMVPGFIAAFFCFKLARLVKQRKNYKLCTFISAFMVTLFPIGSIVGGFSLYFLLDDDIEDEFEFKKY